MTAQATLRLVRAPVLLALAGVLVACSGEARKGAAAGSASDAVAGSGRDAAPAAAPAAMPDSAASLSGDVAPELPPLPPPPATEAGRDSLRDALVEGGLSLPAGGRRALVRELGEPDSVSREPRPNRHVPGQVDTVYTLYYPGLRAEYYDVARGRSLASSAVVRDNRYLAGTPLRIRMTRAEVEDRLGPPQRDRDGDPVYTCARCGGAEDSVVLHYDARDRLEAVEFAYYVD